MSIEPDTEDERTRTRVTFRVEVAVPEGWERDLVTAAQLEAITALLLKGSGGQEHERHAQQVNR